MHFTVFHFSNILSDNAWESSTSSDEGDEETECETVRESSLKRTESTDSTAKYGDSESDTSEYQTPPRLSGSGDSMLGLSEVAEGCSGCSCSEGRGHQCEQGHNLLSFPGECAECNALLAGAAGVPGTPCSDSILIPVSAGSGYLLANQVGCEAPGVEEDLGPAAESLPDGDAREAMLLATATLSTLLSGNAQSIAQSPLDSGLGLGSGSGSGSSDDAGSLSDRSPDRQPAAAGTRRDRSLDDDNDEDVDVVAESLSDHWHVQSIPCSSVISSVKAGESSQVGKSSDEDQHEVARQSWGSAQPGSSALVHRSFFPVSVVPSKEYVHEDEDSLRSLEISSSDPNLCNDVSDSETHTPEAPIPTCIPIRNLLQQVSSADQSDHSKIKLSVVQSSGSDGRDDEWLGLAQGEGQIAICSSNVGRDNAEGSGLYEQYANNWDSLTINQEESQHNSLSIVDPTSRTTWPRYKHVFIFTEVLILFLEV